MKVYKKLLTIFAIILILLPTLLTNISVKSQANYRTYYFTNPNMGWYFMGDSPNRRYYLHTLFGTDEYLAILLSGNLMIFKKEGDVFMNIGNVSLNVGPQYGLFKYNSTCLGVYTDYAGFKVYVINVNDLSWTSTNTLNVGGYTFYLYTYGFTHFFLCISSWSTLNLIKLVDMTLTSWSRDLGAYYVDPFWAGGYYNPSNNKIYIISMWIPEGMASPFLNVAIFDLTNSQFLTPQSINNKHIAGVLNGKFFSYGIELQDVQIVGSTYNLYLSLTGTWKLGDEISMRTKDGLVKVTFQDTGTSVSGLSVSIDKTYIFVDLMSFAGNYRVSENVYSFYFYEPSKSYFQVIRNNTKTNYGPIDVPNLNLAYPFWFTTWGFIQLCNNNQDIKLYLASGGSIAITITPGQTITTSTYYPTTTYYTSQPFATPEANMDFLTNAIIPLTIVSIPALLLAFYLGSVGLIVGLLLGGGILFYSGYAPFGLIFLIVLGAAIILWRGSSGKGER